MRCAQNLARILTVLISALLLFDGFDSALPKAIVQAQVKSIYLATLEAVLGVQTRQAAVR